MNGSTEQKMASTPGKALNSPKRNRIRRSDPEEKDLLAALREGRPDAVRRLTRKYNDRLFAVARRICTNPADAEEVLQDVYLTAMRKVDRFEERSSLSTWLYRITVNTSLMKLRKQRNQWNVIPMDTLSSLSAEEESYVRAIEEIDAPDRALVNMELKEQIRRSVAALPEAYRRVFYLRDVEGYSTKETSEILHTTPAAIKSRLHRTRSMLKEKLFPFVKGEAILAS